MKQLEVTAVVAAVAAVVDVVSTTAVVHGAVGGHSHF